jgi:hypothetical protein
METGLLNMHENHSLPRLIQPTFRSSDGPQFEEQALVTPFLASADPHGFRETL